MPSWQGKNGECDENQEHERDGMLMAADDRQLKRSALKLAQREWGGKIVGTKLRPLAPSLSGLVRDPTAVCSTSGSWFAIATEPREEEHVSYGLAGTGMTAYLPTELREERHGRGQLRFVIRPLITGYLFVRCDLSDQAWHTVTSTRGVLRFLGSEGKPIVVPEQAIEVVRLVEAEKAEKMQAIEVAKEAQRIAKEGGRSGVVWHFTKGDRVRIKNGPFAAFYAQLESAVDAHDRITALVSLFGRASRVELSAFDIEAL